MTTWNWVTVACGGIGSSLFDPAAEDKNEKGTEMQPKPIHEILAQSPSTLSLPQEARTSEQKDALIQTKTKFIDNMAFQIRTLTNAILGFSELLLNEELNETQREYVNEIFSAGQGMVSLVNDVLDMTRLEKGQLQTLQEDCSLGWLLEEIGDKVRPAAKEKGLSFEIITAADIPANILTDPQRLRQCLMILMGNAVKYTQKGFVRIEVSLVRHQDKPYLRFDIIDSGMGIPVDKQPTIFQPYSRYEQVSESMLTSLELGLTANSGLAATAQLVGLLQGRIAMSSEPGKGSIFSLVIPTGVEVQGQMTLEAASAKAVSDASRTDSTMSGSRPECEGHVLVVEDQPSNQTVVQLLLETMGFRVSVADNGQKAVEMAQAGNFDAILMDIKMPVMDGIQAARTLRQQGLIVPILAMSAANEPVGKDFDGFLEKPVDSQGLYHALSRYLPVTQLNSTAAVAQS
ncbi:MAG: response regulator [Phycisphaerae bacterium]|nr:response regulator [Phycisphaerae bacterium]